MDEIYYQHYITVNSENVIVDGFSTAFKSPIESDICINDKGGYQFQLFSDGEENPNLYTEDCISLYKWDGTQVLPRTEEEIQADRDAIPPAPPSDHERIRELENAICENDRIYSAEMANLENALCEQDTKGGNV